MLNVITLLVLLCLCGCGGPIYKTTYNYDFPASTKARNCLLKCKAMRQKCRHWADSSYNQCLDRAAVKQSNRIIRDRGVAYAKTSEFSLSGYSTYLDEDACKQQNKKKLNECTLDYNSCFQLCGGVVEVIERCVHNCQVDAKTG